MTKRENTSLAPLTQRAIDISNLRFYSAMAHDFKWQTDIIHWSVISKTLQEIADRLANDETNFYKIDHKLEQILGPAGGQGATEEK